ncbi:auxin response factor 9-like [Hibiscus syriacus]|uniref:Auxin response factor 9-like n=1 Tax=Hibiscus syriacus TaxID=106335 RepID=A0A6A3A1X7_HIBSY|nr:auxin response factor 9-like [Hibiscus syriacus]
MGSEAEEESSCIPKLPLLSVSHAQLQSPERSGTLTPPFYVSAASVPFRWEEEPGKPKPCTTLATFSSTPNEPAQKCLELPPRLLLDAKVTKLSSPTTVLEGPYMGRARFQSSSFRMGGECYGSFRSVAVIVLRCCSLGLWFLAKEGTQIKGFLVLGGEGPLRLDIEEKIMRLHLLGNTETEKEKTAVGATVLRSLELQGLAALPVSLIPSPTSG